ncbi:MAG: TAXI family TRAP transporter solute-binding subunit [Kineosporiaceae bacterium]
MATPARPCSRRSVLRALAVGAVLAPVTAGCGLRRETPGYPPGEVELLTGGTRGVYYAFGQEIARVARDALPTAPLTAVSTGGSVDNLRGAAGGGRVLAFSALDAAADAVRGTGLFREPLPVTALARVYDDYLHVVARRDGGPTTLAELRGRRVSVGAVGSGTSLIARRVLQAAEVPLPQLRVAQLGIDDSLDALSRGDLDAFFWSGGLPTVAVADLADEVPLSLLPVVEPVRVLRETGLTVYRPATVPAEEYGLPASVDTLAVPNVLVVRADADAALAEALTRLLFERRAEISATVPLAGALDQRSAIFTSPVDLHPGALAYYRTVRT